MSYSVLSYGWRAKYYLRNPLRFLRDTCRNLKWAWQRATRGWADCDTWDFGYWLLDVVPPMLEYWADHANSYPCTEDFPTMESWQAHLRSIANLLNNAQDSARDQKNEWYPAYEQLLEENRNWVETEKLEDGTIIHKVREPSPIVGKYLNRDAELAQEQDVMVEEAFKLLLKTSIKSLWD